jgi:geranylgeranyl pyrophosphate synthase
VRTEDFEAYLQHASSLVDGELARILTVPEPIANLHDASLYALGLDVEGRKRRGKRIRPVLCLLTCEALGGDTTKAMPFAVASELLHNFLLVHDDIQDGDRVRRGRPSTWAKYGMEHGINVGDYLYARSLESGLRSRDVGLSETQVLRLVNLLVDTIRHTGEGQAMDLNARTRRDLGEEDYLRIVTEKTGHYLAAPAVGGAIVAGAGEDVLDAIREFGRFLGPVFQIADDVLDLTQGKGRNERGSDIKEGKRSYLVVYTAARCTTEERERLYDILDAPREDTASEDIQWVVDLFQQYGAVEGAKAKGEELLREAREALAKAPPKLQEALTGAAEFTLARKW